MTRLPLTLVLGLAFAASGMHRVAYGQQSPLPPGTHMPDEAEPTAPASQTALAEEELSAKDYPGARKILDAYLASHPTDARALFDLGYLEDLLGRDDQAIAAYKKSIEADPKLIEAQLALGLLLARKGKANEARPFIEAATLIEPANPAIMARAWRALAQLDRTSDPSRARVALLEALKISPETPADTLLTAEIAEASGDPETAASAYQKVLAAHPESSDASAGMVHLLLKQKKYVEAEAILHSALERDPDDPALNSQWAATLLAEDKPQQAITALEKLHQAHPADALPSTMLADTLSHTGDYAKADALYQGLLAASPGDADLIIGHAQCLLHLRNYSEAMAAFQHALKIKPDDGEGWTGLALASSEGKEYATALEALSMRSKYEAETPATYFLRATAYDNLHQLKSAVEFYQKFLVAAHGNFPDQEWQAKHRLIALGITR